MPRLYQQADAFFFTSLQESFGVQVLEAMGHGLPVLTLDHQGVGTFIPSEAGIKVPVTSPQRTVAELAEGIRRLALFPEERWKMGEAALAYAKTQTWERRAERMSEMYEEVLQRPIVREATRSCSSSVETSVRLGGGRSLQLLWRHRADAGVPYLRSGPGVRIRTETDVKSFK
jgi:hypothetical protein